MIYNHFVDLIDVLVRYSVIRKQLGIVFLQVLYGIMIVLFGLSLSKQDDVSFFWFQALVLPRWAIYTCQQLQGAHLRRVALHYNVNARVQPQSLAIRGELPRGQDGAEGHTSIAAENDWEVPVLECLGRVLSDLHAVFKYDFFHFNHRHCDPSESPL